MRNCFVPHCDQSRSTAKCMMFMPPKLPDMFERWHSVLPKHRDFKPTDRVCERHFQPGDIRTTWDHIINGELVRMERTKAMLLPHAVPSQNLQLGSARNNVKTTSNRRPAKAVGALKRVKKPASAVESQKPTKSQKIMTDDDHIEILFEIHPEPETNEKNMVKNDDDDDRHSITAGNDEVLDDQILEEDEMHGDDTLAAVETASALPQHNYLDDEDGTNNSGDHDEDVDDASFEHLYDDIYEVMLPDTMYGIHRDPERTFIVFSLFDAIAMRSSKVLRIDRSGRRVRTYIDSVLCTDMRLSELSVDLVTEKLADLDASRLCRTVVGQKEQNGTLTDSNVEEWGVKCLRLVAYAGADVCASCA